RDSAWTYSGSSLSCAHGAHFRDCAKPLYLAICSASKPFLFRAAADAVRRNRLWSWTMAWHMADGECRHLEPAGTQCCMRNLSAGLDCPAQTSFRGASIRAISERGASRSQNVPVTAQTTFGLASGHDTGVMVVYVYRLHTDFRRQPWTGSLSRWSHN